jgi:hypothetical protein
LVHLEAGLIKRSEEVPGYAAGAIEVGETREQFFTKHKQILR